MTYIWIAVFFDVKTGWSGASYILHISLSVASMFSPASPRISSMTSRPMYKYFPNQKIMPLPSSRDGEGLRIE